MAEPLYDVAIVGFGPSGAVAAALLGQAGFKVFVADRAHEVYDRPRAIALDHEVLRVFQQLGVVEQIEPFMEPFTDSCYYGVDGELIRRMTMVAPPYPQGYTPSVVFTQPPLEQALRRAVAARPSVIVQTGLTVVDLQQTPEQVLLHCRAEDGREQQVRARYAIGCDGASSTVRERVGITLRDLSFDEPWLVVDVLANAQGLAKLPTTSVQYCEPERPCTYVIGPKNHRRWEISLKAGEDPRAVVEDDATWALLSRWLTPADGTLWRQAAYRFHALVAEQWRVGRVFIAGDAAHQQPPFLGQGMCQGVRDVVNLAWKLAAVLHGEVQGAAADTLLDSYGLERQAHVTELTTRLKGIGAVICERDVAAARSRDRQMLAEGVAPRPRQDVLPRLSTGLLDGSPAAGSLAPQPWLQLPDRRVRMDHWLGCGWRLLIAAGSDLGGPTPEQARMLALQTLRLGHGEGCLAEAEGVMARWFAAQGCQAVLLRPDHYVYGTAADAAGLRALLDGAKAALHG
ncbi:bifunctional 3-(3-hydroxy-phenyl)propionate/3-hydroxycinnamic acid hydroxylase [Aquabacterium sp. OR-4]|uniref:bifunctional 3-(3-hydroxy-phenyl)propionate/3-hydroxycinnamic acid hydroxylase n=1 Tax=Aquabacterium sp. OR-4 TaxID=2978127 RepID=UPI0028C69009|nr:bifunctional 3-(3-hydroxy-phenyl)propionate/3-hydroxycinnamic acid hydroxylase [Aquabacterium sp. OR-4]MDT7837919.1 bifunctional 3-(3-hydroxy-phenyl)propionate/3-hydroxycinnamic acid hydroxylase [Aquabacterium sp. OR-4]